MVNKSERKLRRVVRGPSVEGALEILFIVTHGGGKPSHLIRGIQLTVSARPLNRTRESSTFRNTSYLVTKGGAYRHCGFESHIPHSGCLKREHI